MIQRQLPTMDHIELLSVLRTSREESFPLRRLAEQVRKPAELVGLCLDMLVAGGLVAQLSDGSYRYSAMDETDRVSDDVLRLYNERPVTLVKLLYERPPSERSAIAATTFAAAFRLRKNP